MCEVFAMNIVITFVVGILTGRYVLELLDMFIQFVNANLQRYITKVNKDIYTISQEMEGGEVDTFAVGFQDTSADYEDEVWDDEEEFEDKKAKKK